MAIDQTNIALDMGSKTVNAVDNLMEAIEELQSIEDQRIAAGIDLTDFNDDFVNSGISHVDGVSLNAVLNTSIPEIWKFTTGDVTAVLGQQHDDNLQKVRS